MDDVFTETPSIVNPTLKSPTWATKIVFAEQLATGLQVWREPLKQMRIPKMFDLRSDPFEAGEDSIRYNDWFVEHVPFQYAAQAVVHQWLESFKEFPPRQKAAS